MLGALAQTAEVYATSWIEKVSIQYLSTAAEEMHRTN